MQGRLSIEHADEPATTREVTGVVPVKRGRMIASSVKQIVHTGCHRRDIEDVGGAIELCMLTFCSMLEKLSTGTD